EKPPVNTPEELNAVVDELLRSHRRALEEHPQKVSIIYSLMFEAMGPAPDMRKEVAKLMQRQRSDMVNFVKYAQSVGTMPADLDPEGHATWFIAALRGIVYQYLMDPDAIDLTATYRELKKHLVARLELANLLAESTS
ncbi:MAG: TetR family transcriptional regulator C-terminal domain-containing protein, partial [Solirubrobacterales bacterium]